MAATKTYFIRFNPLYETPFFDLPATYSTQKVLDIVREQFNVHPDINLILLGDSICYDIPGHANCNNAPLLPYIFAVHDDDCYDVIVVDVQTKHSWNFFSAKQQETVRDKTMVLKVISTNKDNNVISVKTPRPVQWNMGRGPTLPRVYHQLHQDGRVLVQSFCGPMISVESLCKGSNNNIFIDCGGCTWKPAQLSNECAICMNEFNADNNYQVSLGCCGYYQACCVCIGKLRDDDAACPQCRKPALSIRKVIAAI